MADLKGNWFMQYGENTKKHSSTGKIIDGRYEILELIDAYVFCTTFLAKDIKSNKIWMVMVCDKTSDDYFPEIRDYLLRAIQETRSIKHPFIAKIIDMGEDDEGIYVVQEYVEGVSLETIVKTNGVQPVDKVVEWGKQLCDVLNYLHKLTPPYIYRGVQPKNIILSPDGCLKLIDIGITRLSNYIADYIIYINDYLVDCAPGYDAPEQRVGDYRGYNHTDARTDIYSLGMTMCRLVTGVDPCVSPYITFPICQINPNLPKGLEYIISKCTQPDPSVRYQNCDELMADLDNYIDLPKPKSIFGKLFKRK